jgi:Protein of unknown function (DUF1553)/Protein of unknown function (DUF1549)/Planctomycete cytochrome C
MQKRSHVAALIMGLCFLACWLPIAAERAGRQARTEQAPAERRPHESNPHERQAHVERVHFQRDVQPILAAHCYACHGPASEGEGANRLRLDQRAHVVRSVIVPGNAAKSVLLARLTHSNPRRRMPPPGANRTPLTPEQVALMQRWIDEGAPYERHWAFAPLAAPPVPEAHAILDGVRNPIDDFIAAAQSQRGLRPSPPAAPVTLIRRLSFDLTGLPPSPEEVDAFVHDDSPAAHDRLVTRLLASPHFGERMAILWLDLVRYADTDGYAIDTHRDVWMYRDFVVDAFNRNQPFDRFTVQQIAGDLLPNASQQDRVGSGYNRLLMTSQEGCADPKEYTHRYAADRVRNVASVWLGVTLGCAECHDHKFDPFPARDFYRMAAFFADVKENGVGPLEFARFGSAAQEAQLKNLDSQIAALELALVDRERALSDARVRWEADARQGRGLPKVVAEALDVEPAARTPDEKNAVDEQFRSTTPALQPLHRARTDLQKQRSVLLNTIPASLVTTSGAPRVVRVLPRGNWADDSGEVVDPGLPAALAGAVPSDRRLTRLDLAQWLVDADNPLVARVFVNRLWQLAFGRGLVATPEDFGSRGTPPTHPKLLDWLAAEFIASGWDVKHMLRLIVTSSTYRQSSHDDPELVRGDFDNRWLTRQNRYRLDAELVRDNALAISGLLVPRVGGRSVRPYQPEGFWASRFTEKEYRHDMGDGQHRRGLYTYWCRSYLHPALQAFDAPSRQSCVPSRGASSTPFQALVLLNDPTHLEAARAFASRVLREGAPSTLGRLDCAMRLAQSRPASLQEQALLVRLLDKHLREFRADPAAAAEVIGTGDAPTPSDIDAAELAAWTSVTRAILNLHDTITRK